MLEDVTVIQRVLAAFKVLAPVLLATRGRRPIESEEEALKSKPRRAIMRLVDSRPGISQIEILRKLDMSSSSLDLHLKTLAKVGLIETRSSGRFVLVYRRGQAPGEGDPLLVPESTRRIARLILVRPRSTADLAHELGLAPRVVRRHVKTLLDLGLIAEDVEGRNVTYVPTDHLIDAAKSWA